MHLSIHISRHAAEGSPAGVRLHDRCHGARNARNKAHLHKLSPRYLVLPLSLLLSPSSKHLFTDLHDCLYMRPRLLPAQSTSLTPHV